MPSRPLLRGRADGAASRREFLAVTATATAGVLLTGTRPSAAPRRQVTFAGRRVKVVDGHAHCVVPEALDVLKDTPLGGSIRTALAATGTPLVIPGDRIQQMEEQGIEVEVLSINPFWYA